MRLRQRITAMALAVLSFGGACVATAPRADATTYTGYGPYLNNSWTYTTKNSQAGSTVSVYTRMSFDEADPFSEDLHFPRYNGALQNSGGSATLRLSIQTLTWDELDPTICNGSVDDPTKFRVEIRDSGGTQVGSTDWEPTYNHGCSETDVEYDDSKVVYFDNNPLDNDNSDGALAPGKYTIYFKYLDDDGTNNANLADQDSIGTHAVGPNGTEAYASGYFHVTDTTFKYLNGSSADGNSESELAATEADQGTSGATKNFALVRDFKSSWGLPSSRVRNWAEEGKSVVWSTKPKDESVTYTCTQNGGAVEECTTGDTPWDKSAANSDGASGTTIRTIIENLQDIINDQGANKPAFMGFAITHEPHDDAIITNNGYYGSGGSGTAKCGDGSSGTGNPGANANGGPCHGTADDYKDLYEAMKDRQQDSCGASNDPTGQGQPCNGVVIMYIGVGSNMYDASSPSSEDVGADDQLRPATGDIDMLGADTYNYSCFNDMPERGTDGVVTGGTALSSATFGFQTSDVGDNVRGLNGAGNTTWISSRSSSTAVTLGSSVTNGTGLTFDVYNDGECDATDWETFEEVVDDPGASTGLNGAGHKLSVLGLADMLDKKVVIAEYASHPGCDGVEYGLYQGCQAEDTDGSTGLHDFDRDAWFNEQYVYMSSDTQALTYIVGMAYFSSSGCTDGCKTDHDWRFLTPASGTGDPGYDPVGLATWQSRIGSDSRYLSTSVGYTLDLTP